MEKSAEAFRSIGETARLIGVAPHVLRYWETQFPQLKPVKRNDGRRYYRPDDVRLAAGLYEMLREEGLTIRGAKKQIARDRGDAVRARGAERLGDLMGAEIEVAAPKPAARQRKRRKPDDSTLPLFPASTAPEPALAQPAAAQAPVAATVALSDPEPAPEPLAPAADRPASPADPAPVSALPRLLRLRKHLDNGVSAPELPGELPRKLRELNDILSAAL